MDSYTIALIKASQLGLNLIRKEVTYAYDGKTRTEYTLTRNGKHLCKSESLAKIYRFMEGWS